MAMVRAVRRTSQQLWQVGTMYIFKRFFSTDGPGKGGGTLGVTSKRFLRHTSPVPLHVKHAEAILAAPQTKVSVLPNGLRVATESHLGSLRTATLGLYIDAGSRFETYATNGIAHFVEHMIFKGTCNRSADELGEAVECAGAQLLASTSREQTSFTIRILQDDVPFALDLLADIVQNSTFDPAAIEQERKTILQEFEEVQGGDDKVLFDHLHSTAFQFCPLGRTILGSPGNVEAMTRANLVDYVQQHYTAPRMVLVGAGAVEHKHVVKLARKAFTSLSADPYKTARHLIDAHPSVFTGSEVRIRDDDLPNAQVAIAVMGASWTDPDSIALMVMQTMLGSWNTDSVTGKHAGSEVAQRVAADGLAVSVMAFNIPYSDGGLFGIHAVAKGEDLDDLSWVIMHEFGRLMYELDESEVQRAKNQLKTNMALKLENTSGIAEVIGQQLLTYGRRVCLTELFERIDTVNAATLKRVAKRFIYDRELAIVAIGPTQKLRDYSWFRCYTYRSSRLLHWILRKIFEFGADMDSSAYFLGQQQEFVLATINLTQ